MTNPPTTNQTAATIDSIVKGAGGTLVNVAEALCIAEAPFLGLPVIKQFWELGFQWVASKFILAAETGATFAVIDVQVSKEETNVSAALAAVIAAEKSGNPDAIKSAIQAYANSQSALASYDGSSTPS
jgi:hypothetical protein